MTQLWPVPRSVDNAPPVGRGPGSHKGSGVRDALPKSFELTGDNGVTYVIPTDLAIDEMSALPVCSVTKQIMFKPMAVCKN